MPRSFAWRAFARIMAALFALIPRRRRFAAAIVLCRVFTPFLGTWLRRRAGRGLWCSTPFDESMRLVMRALADGGTLFDPPFVVDAATPIESRALYLSGHFPINAFVVRWMHDEGIEMAVLKSFPEIDPCVWGTRHHSDAVEDTPALFVKLLRRIEAGRPALMLIDNDSPPAVAFESKYGNGHVSTQAFAFAQRFAIPTYFCSARSDRNGRPVVTVRRIDPEPQAFLEQLLGP